MYANFSLRWRSISSPRNPFQLLPLRLITLRNIATLSNLKTLLRSTKINGREMRLSGRLQRVRRSVSSIVDVRTLRLTVVTRKKRLRAWFK